MPRHPSRRRPRRHAFRVPLYRFPADDLQIEDEDGIEHRDQDQGDDGGDRKAADLGVAEGIDSEEKATREVCLDSEKNDRIAFQAQADYQIMPSDGCGSIEFPWRWDGV